MWTLWFALHTIAFAISVKAHTFYNLALTPALAALAAIGLFHLVGRRWLPPMSIAATAAWGWYVAQRFPTFAPWLPAAVAIAGVIAVVALAIALRDEVEPGSEAQIGYGLLGSWVEPASGRRRRVWAFVMVLACSQHMFVRPVLTMDQQSWTAAHVAAFEFFGGVAKRLVPDNLLTGVARTDLYDPKINRSYAGLAEHYGVRPGRVGGVGAASRPQFRAGRLEHSHGRTGHPHQGRQNLVLGALAKPWASGSTPG